MGVGRAVLVCVGVGLGVMVGVAVGVAVGGCVGVGVGEGGVARLQELSISPINNRMQKDCFFMVCLLESGI